MEEILEVNRYGSQWILESEEKRLKDVEEKRNKFLCVLPRKIVLSTALKKKFLRFQKHG